MPVWITDIETGDGYLAHSIKECRDKTDMVGFRLVTQTFQVNPRAGTVMIGRTCYEYEEDITLSDDEPVDVDG